MNKKIIALAVGSAIGAFGASAAFAQSNVTLSGSLNFNYGMFNNGATGLNLTNNNAASTARGSYDALSNQESQWAIAGEEKLDGGMTAFFLCSTSMDITGGTAANMCARNSYIGLKGGFGSINMGNYDAPAKRMSALYDPFPISAAMGQGAQMWNATASNTVNGATPASFSRRQANLVTYDMPKMGGIDASFAFTSTNEASAMTTATTVQKPRMWSAMVNYTNGPLGLGVAYESHTNFNPAATAAANTYTGGDDTMVSLAAGYSVSSALRLSGIWNSMKYGTVNAAGADMSVKTWGLYADWNVTGPYRVRAGYSVQNSTSGSFGAGAQASYTTIGSWTANGGAGDTGAQKIHLEGVQALSKRTEVGLTYAQVTNDRYSNITIGTGGATSSGYGEKSTFMGMLIRHKF
jgi:hypothetical protein